MMKVTQEVPVARSADLTTLLPCPPFRRKEDWCTGEWSSPKQHQVRAALSNQERAGYRPAGDSWRPAKFHLASVCRQTRVALTPAQSNPADSFPFKGMALSRLKAFAPRRREVLCANFVRHDDCRDESPKQNKYCQGAHQFSDELSMADFQ